MKQNIWVERGLEALQQSQWFDALQMLQGAIERSGRQNQPDVAERIIAQLIPKFPEDQVMLACELVREIITRIRKRKSQMEWVRLVSTVFTTLRKLSRQECLRTVKNQIIMDHGLQDKDFLLNLEALIVEEKRLFFLPDLYYCKAGLLSKRKDYVRCYETLQDWKEHTKVTPPFRTYILLAELNAYEIEGCTEYLAATQQEFDEEAEQYAILAERICRAVELTDQVEFNTILVEYNELINPHGDGLLKSLCDGIAGIFQPTQGTGLLGSLFGARDS